MVKSKYFKTGNKYNPRTGLDTFDLNRMFVCNFSKHELYIYMKAVVEFNKRCGEDILYIYENAYSKHGNYLSKYYSLMYSNEHYSSDLSYFWALIDKIEYRYKDFLISYNDDDAEWYNRYLYEKYKKSKEFFERYKNYSICLRNTFTGKSRIIKIRKR